MDKLDFIFFMMGTFAYFSIMFNFKDHELKQKKVREIGQKKQLYAMQIKAIQEREDMDILQQEKAQRHKDGLANMKNTVQMLSDFSDREVMRQSKITSGKF